MLSITRVFRNEAFDQNEWIKSINDLLDERAQPPRGEKDCILRSWIHTWGNRIYAAVNCAVPMIFKKRDQALVYEGTRRGLPNVSLGQTDPDTLAQLIERITRMAMAERDADSNYFPLVGNAINNICRDIPGAAKIVVDTLGDAPFVFDGKDVVAPNIALHILELAIKTDPTLLTDEAHARLFYMMVVCRGFGHVPARNITRMKPVTTEVARRANELLDTIDCGGYQSVRDDVANVRKSLEEQSKPGFVNQQQVPA